MAARTAHYALAMLITQKLYIKDVDRFIAGSLIPDAIEHNGPNHALTHYKVTLNEDKKLIDTKAFLDSYMPLILEDDLYLGYYLHLIQDAVYRKFLYFEEGFHNNRDGKFVEELHNDYKLLNVYMIQKYGLKELEHEIEMGKLRNIYDFKYQELLRDLKTDFVYKGEGKTLRLTEEVIDRYIDNCCAVCIDEVRALRSEKTVFDYMTYAWDRV